MLLAGSALAATDSTGSVTNRFGGPAYTGAPALEVTAAKVASPFPLGLQRWAQA